MTPKKFTQEQAMAESRAAIDRFMGRSKKKKKAKPPPACVCTNHMGTSKQRYKTRESAVEAIMRNHLWTGKTHGVYPCPTSSYFHVTSRVRPGDPA